ncbi:MAG TPA: acyl-CoA dehydrogenase family protein, partial [Hyphomicrobiaceae bacterium]|nr:acyl-CoA dehydrogenase family protein [Hyphomicrobiaceae bacterium]
MNDASPDSTLSGQPAADHQEHAIRADRAIARACGLVDILKAAAPRIEAARELPPDVLSALHDARMFRLLIPRSLDGEELDLVSHAKVMETIASGDASAAWVMGQGGGCAMASAYMEPQAARRLFGPADAVLAWGAGIQGRAVPVAGGYQVTGKWQFASGSRHATLLGGHSFVFESDGTPRLKPDGTQVDRTMLFARDKADVHDVWDVMGLRGTGSDTFEVADLFVPDDETVNRDDAAECREPGTLYKFSTSLAYGVGFAALQIGIARTVLDDLRTL